MKLRNTAGIYYFQKKKYLAVDDFVDEDVAKIITEEYLEKQNRILRTNLMILSVLSTLKRGMVNPSVNMSWSIVFLRWKHLQDSNYFQHTHI